MASGINGMLPLSIYGKEPNRVMLIQANVTIKYPSRLASSLLLGFLVINHASKPIAMVIKPEMIIEIAELFSKENEKGRHRNIKAPFIINSNPKMFTMREILNFFI